MTTGLLFTCCNDLESGGLQDQGAWSSKDGDGVSSFGQGESGKNLFGGWLVIPFSWAWGLGMERPDLVFWYFRWSGNFARKGPVSSLEEKQKDDAAAVVVAAAPPDPAAEGGKGAVHEKDDDDPRAGVAALPPLSSDNTQESGHP